MLRFARLAVSISFIVLGAVVASSQGYPTKPIRIYSGLPGGGDVAARMIAGGITGPWASRSS